MDFDFVRQRTAFKVHAQIREGDTAQVIVTTSHAETEPLRPTEHQKQAATARRARFAPDLAWPEDSPAANRS